MNKQMLIDQIQTRLHTGSGLLLVYLFGSMVEEHTGPKSDIDLGILVENDADATQEHARLSHELGKMLGTDRIDIVLLNRAPIELAYAVIAQGVCIYQRNVAERVEFEAKVLSQYGDYLTVLRAFRKDILQGEKHGRRIQRYRKALRRTERTISQITAAQE